MARSHLFAVLRSLLYAALTILNRAEHEDDGNDEEFELVPENHGENPVRKKHDWETRLRFASAEGSLARRKLTDPDTILGTNRLSGLPKPRFWLLVRDSAGEVCDPVLVFTTWHQIAPRVVRPGRVAHRRENLAPLSLVFDFASKKEANAFAEGGTFELCFQ